jgi:hypothetical protein
MRRRRGAVPLAGALTLLIAAAGAADASASCGGTVRARAHGYHALRPPLVIGDSTMIFAAPWLGRHGMTADAKGCRQFSEGAAMLAARARAGRLPVLSILALGANGPVSRHMIDRVLHAIGRRHLLGLVTARRSAVTDASMHAAVRRHPGRVLLIDWVRFSAGHGSWFAGDGLHVTPAAGRIYANFIARTAAPIEYPPVKALHPPHTSRGSKDCGKVRQLGRPLGVRVIRGRVSCRIARRLARRTPVEPTRGWKAYFWRATGRLPWFDLYQRRDRRALVGTTRMPRRR